MDTALPIPISAFVMLNSKGNLTIAGELYGQSLPHGNHELLIGSVLLDVSNYPVEPNGLRLDQLLAHTWRIENGIAVRS